MSFTRTESLSIVVAMVFVALLTIVVWVLIYRETNQEEQVSTSSKEDSIPIAELKKALLNEKKKVDLQNMLIEKYRNNDIESCNNIQPQKSDSLEELANPDMLVEKAREKDRARERSAREYLEKELNSGEKREKRSKEIKEELEDMLSDDTYAGTTIDAITCVEDFCKIQLLHGSIESSDQFFQKSMFEKVLSSAQMFFIDFSKNGDKVKRTIYLADEGKELPKL